MQQIDLSTKNPQFSHVPRGGLVLNAIKVLFSADTFMLPV